MKMEIKNQVVFVTGASRGLGLAFAQEAVARGAKKVYAGVRDVAAFSQPGITPIRLDVTKQDSIDQAAAACADVTVLVNNAGIAKLNHGSLDDDIIDVTRELMETNFFGVVRMSKAFAPALAANGGGAILNVLSDATWIAIPMLAAYASSKSAAWSFTNSLRLTLKEKGTRVLALHVGFLDTDMTKGLDMPKTQPAVVAQRVYDGLANGADEVLADEGTKAIKRGLSPEQSVYLNPSAL
jgi:NAD(P)-dependent dehydrogenase (short-subunit alcohol dehydrogenase family)